MDTLRNLELPLAHITVLLFLSKTDTKTSPPAESNSPRALCTFSMCVLLTVSPPHANRYQFGAQEWLEF